MNILAVSVTESGRCLGARLPYARAHGDLAATVRAKWREVDGFVLFVATGAAVRVIAPLLGDKRTDPAVVSVDEAGRYAVALCGGHHGANTLARDVAGILGAEAVVTTATDQAGLPALDLLPGFTAIGDLAGVTAAMLDGRRPRLDLELHWPLPPGLPMGSGPERIVVTDHQVLPAPGVVALHPPSLVAGIGTSSDAPVHDVAALLAAALADAGLAPASVGTVATIDRRRDAPGIRALGRPIVTFSAEALAAVDVPTPSATVAAAVATPSVAEAAALLAAGPGATLVVPKRKNAVATVALARRCGPQGQLRVVGLGPGAPAHRTPAAASAVRSADLVIGYEPYVDQCADLLNAHQEILRMPIGTEVQRAERALQAAAAGHVVALVCSGDAGIYAMASIVVELADAHAPDIELEVIPGVTAMLAASALLGAPLGHDHAVISLSDLLTPWPVIEQRLYAAAKADLVVALYNPRSRGRTQQFVRAREILLEHRPPDTPVGLVTDAARSSQSVLVTTLGDLDDNTVGMTTCVLVGSSTSRTIAGRMVTPRGYPR